MVISLSHRDGDNDWARAGIFVTVMQQYGSLDLLKLWDTAITVPNGPGRTHVSSIIQEFRDIPSKAVRDKVIIAQLGMVGVDDNMRGALSGAITYTTPTGLHTAWQQHVCHHRRGRIQYDLESSLRSVEDTVEELATLVVGHGVTWEAVRYV